jgi:nucleoside-diphosphate-sugar epimerase
MASLLIIGGSGFFGKSILDAFKRNLLDTWKIDNLIIMARHPEELQKNNPELIKKNTTLIKGDISFINELPFADYVIHAAASADARNYLERPLEEHSNIISGTLNYCRLAKKYHQKSKIVYVSSGAVYGIQPSNLDKIPENLPFLNAEKLPVSKRDYAYAKRDAEKKITALGASGLNITIARCFAFVGPWLPLDRHFAIGNFINDGLHNRKIEVKAIQKVYRSYMYADDLVEWLMTIVANANPSCPIYNVGSDQAILIKELAVKVGVFFGQEINITSYSSHQEDRYIPDISKIKKELGLNLKYDLDNSIIRTVEKLQAKNPG